jgi:hypothetical protein
VLLCDSDVWQHHRRLDTFLSLRPAPGRKLNRRRTQPAEKLSHCRHPTGSRHHNQQRISSRPFSGHELQPGPFQLSSWVSTRSVEDPCLGAKSHPMGGCKGRAQTLASKHADDVIGVFGRAINPGHSCFLEDSYHPAKWPGGAHRNRLFEF